MGKIRGNNIGKDAAILSFSKIIVTTISMVIAMLLSRFATLEEYGTFSQILIIVDVFVIIFMLGLPNSINFFLSRASKKEDQQQFVSVYYSLTTILSILVGVILIIIMPLLVGYFDNYLLSTFFYVIAILPWTKIVLSSIENVLIVYKKTNLLMKFRVLNSLFLLLTISSVVIFKFDFKTYMMMYTVVQVIFTLSVYVIVKNTASKLSFSLNKKIIRTILKFSLPIGIASMVGVLSKECDKLMIGGFYDTEKLAIYTNAARELPVTVIAASLTAVMMPQLVRLLQEDRKIQALDLWKNATSLSYIFISYFAIGIFVFAPEVITLLYSDKYIEGANILRVYSLVLLFRCTYFGIILNSTGRTKLILYSAISSLSLNVILNIAFYFIFGFVGPAIATLFATLFGASIQLLWTSKTLSISIAKIFPWRQLLNTTLLNILLGFVFLLVKIYGHLDLYIGQIFEAVSLAVIWGIIYVAINYKTINKRYNKLNINF